MCFPVAPSGPGVFRYPCVVIHLAILLIHGVGFDLTLAKLVRCDDLWLRQTFESQACMIYDEANLISYGNALSIIQASSGILMLPLEDALLPTP